MRLAYLSFLLLAGCHVQSSEPVYALGAQALSGYRLLAGANTSMPAGDLGFLITANGQGGYSLHWTDTAGSLAQFSGSVTTDLGFDPNATVKYGGSDVTFTSDKRVDLSGAPGADLMGMEFVAQSDPVYYDLYVEGSRQGFGIYFTGAHTQEVQSSDYDPVAFTSP